MTRSRSAADEVSEFARPYPFFALPKTALSERDGQIRGLGLARLLDRLRLGRRPEFPHRCQLRPDAHAYVYSAELDLNLVRGDGLHWDVELGALATEPDDASIAKLQRRLAALEPPTKPQVTQGVVGSHGLIWTDGSPVPVSTRFERCHAVIPVLGLISENTDAARAFGRCLRNPDDGLDQFLRACLVAGRLDEQLDLVDAAEDRFALRALFGEPVLADAEPAIVALATD